MVQIKKDSKFNPDVDSILFNGDCLELISTIPDNFVKLIVTSPPYNLDKIYENKMEMKEYIKGQGKVIKGCFRILDDNGSICWQVGKSVDNVNKSGKKLSTSFASSQNRWKNNHLKVQLKLIRA